MTEPAPTPTLAEVNLSITDASREYISAARARPRDLDRIAAAKDTLDDLIALRDQFMAAGV